MQRPKEGEGGYKPIRRPAAGLGRGRGPRRRDIPAVGGHHVQGVGWHGLEAAQKGLHGHKLISHLGRAAVGQPELSAVAELDRSGLRMPACCYVRLRDHYRSLALCAFLC